MGSGQGGSRAGRRGGATVETLAQESARRSAEYYLYTHAFSREGLIHQLKFEGFSTNNATHAADAIGPNWNEQAAKSADSYLAMSGLTRSSLIEQLEFDGYTHNQATYGANQAGP